MTHDQIMGVAMSDFVMTYNVAILDSFSGLCQHAVPCPQQALFRLRSSTCVGATHWAMATILHP